jgi:hypothetical protein
MLSLPKEAQLLEQFRPAFSRPTYQRFLVLCIGSPQARWPVSSVS